MQSVSAILRDPAFVEVAHKGETSDTIEQFIVPVGSMQKASLLRLLLAERGSKRVIVFTDTKTRAEICTGQLKRAGFRAESIHSDKTQAQRKRALAAFSKGDVDVLVATDVPVSYTHLRAPATSPGSCAASRPRRLAPPASG